MYRIGLGYDIHRLDCDSTSFYPYRSKKAVPKDIRKTFKSSYDTYKIKGLPAGPICNPGIEAILAAIYPDDTDYLYDVVSNASNTSPTVQLTMKHIRSKLVVKVKRGDYTGDGVITTGTVSGSSMMLNGNFDVKTEKFQSTEGSGTLSFTGTVSGEGTLEDQWFVFSKFGGSASKLSFNLTIDGIKYPTAQSTEGVIFEKGKKYIYTLTISNHKVEVSKVDIEPWADGKDEDVTITD